MSPRAASDRQLPTHLFDFLCQLQFPDMVGEVMAAEQGVVMSVRYFPGKGNEVKSFLAKL